MNLKITSYKRIYSQSQINMASTNNMYSVTAFIGDEFVFQSDIFHHKEDAKNLMNLLKSSDTGDITFQYYKHFPRGKVYGGYTYTEENYITEEIEYTETTCTSMTIYSHDEVDNTFILEPSVNNEYYGQHGFLGAKWSEDYLGWILTPTQYKLAMSYGASVSTICEEDDNNHDYPSMTLYLHDEDADSYLLEPPKDSVHYGQSDFFDGYWSQQHEGWIFSSSQADELIELGVTVYRDADTTEAEEEAEATYEGCTIEYYKNGLLMTTPKSNSIYGEPYLGEGFWNKKLKGWVFKTDQLDDLVANGAKLIKQEASASASEPSINFKKMKFYDYGKGYLLVPNKSCKSKGEKYFHDGYWMPKNDGWFFRTRFCEFVENCGAKYMGEW